jgi:hypothetical protein
MSFNFLFTPPWPTGSVFREGAIDRITRLDTANGCFSMNNGAIFTQTIFGGMVVRIRTPPLIPPFSSIGIETDSTAHGRVAAAALPGFARGVVEARLRVFTSAGMRLLAEAGPVLFGGSAVMAPAFFALGFEFNGMALTDRTFPATVSSVGLAPLIVELRIVSGAVAAGWANATADVRNACVTSIRVFSL